MSNDFIKGLIVGSIFTGGGSRNNKGCGCGGCLTAIILLICTIMYLTNSF